MNQLLMFTVGGDVIRAFGGPCVSRLFRVIRGFSVLGHFPFVLPFVSDFGFRYSDLSSLPERHGKRRKPTET